MRNPKGIFSKDIFEFFRALQRHNKKVWMDANREQLYAGISSDTVTVGMRIYAEPKRKLSSIALIAEPRIVENPKWLAQQKRRLGKKYESYWYSTVKGEWTRNPGWPTAADWPKLQGWIVRKKLSTAAATRATFPDDVAKIFRDLYPLLKFTSL